MERRLLTFFIASTAFFLFYMSLRAMFAPPPQVPAAAENVAKIDGTGDTDPSIGDPEADDPEVENSPTTAGSAPEQAIERPESPTWVTLGSMDPAENFHLLITLNSLGGGVERIEITERDEQDQFKYRRVDVRSGYLGYLAASNSASMDGVTVNVVGPGTPADLAGLAVGDVIVELGGESITDPLDFEERLLETKVGQNLSLKVMRNGSSVPLELTATLTEHPLDLVRLAKDGGIDQVAGNLSRLSCLITMAQVGRKSIPVNERSIPNLADPANLNWDVVPFDDEQTVRTSAEFNVALSAKEMKAVGGLPIKLRRTYTLAPNTFAVDMGLEIENLGDQPQDLAYRLEGPNGITLEGWWYSTKICPNWFSGAAARDLVYNTVAEDHELISGYELLKFARKNPKDPNQSIFAPSGDDATRQLKYIGIDAQYFNVAYLPKKHGGAKKDEGGTFRSFRRGAATVVADVDAIPRHKERAINTSFYLDSNATTVPAGGKIRQELRMFAGPKQPDLLPEFGLSETIYYGWFSTFAKLLAGFLHILAGFLGNYGIAIILLTIIVRAGMFPLSRKAAVNAQKMQELAPELKKINEKYKDDMEARMKATREFQARVGFNPMAGCLPMFLQIPIFMGLYRALSVDIELRQQSFISGINWASNLAAPDKFHYWGEWMIDYIAGRGTGWLGPYFNVLPVFVVGLFLAQQKLFMPPATDEQTRMTQKMMGFMTLFMGLFFFKAPAGLCLYFITSSLWGIGERILVKKTLPKTKHFDASVLEGSAVPTEKKNDSLAERIKSQVKKPEPAFERPNKRKRPKKK